MLSSPNQSDSQTLPASNVCLPCDIPAFCHNRYYRGKLLTERDFSDEQQYLRDRARLHTLALHGWGVVCGLKVRPHEYCPDLRLVVEEGFAIDCCGREIRVLEDTTVELPQPPPPPKQPAAPIAQGTAAAAPDADATACDEPGPMLKDLYLCIAYTECETEYSPAPFDDCACATGSALQANRVCEGFRLELYEGKPDFWDKVVDRRCEADDCRDLYGEGCEACPKPVACCVPLAVIFDFVPGRRISEEQIRIGGRRQLASTETLDRVVRCMLEKLPTGELTQIEDINWSHSQSYLSRDFMADFISSAEHHRGFRVSFTREVEARKLDSRSFRAYVVFRPEDPAQPRHVEFAPIEEIQKDEEATHWCRLVINREYAHQRLEGRDFDLYLTLACDVITDLRGMAVDGNFINGRLPTGDCVQGGTFESWISVRCRRPERPC
ncbi:hypothetical protein [Candidatus Binatus sp.]|uniref:hypothetical protein n=1 Tax=Candidatus Binatus sp. TaxID=2811406 RepID=UPI003CC6CE06